MLLLLPARHPLRVLPARLFLRGNGGPHCGSLRRWGGRPGALKRRHRHARRRLCCDGGPTICSSGPSLRVRAASGHDRVERVSDRPGARRRRTLRSRGRSGAPTPRAWPDSPVARQVVAPGWPSVPTSIRRAVSARVAPGSWMPTTGRPGRSRSECCRRPCRFLVLVPPLRKWPVPSCPHHAGAMVALRFFRQCPRLQFALPASAENRVGATWEKTKKASACGTELPTGQIRAGLLVTVLER